MHRFFLLSSVTIASAEVCRILALSGGGDRGSYESGVIKGLLSELSTSETSWDIVTGASVGALNAASSVIFNVGNEKEWSAFLENMWLSIEKKKVYKNWPLGIVQGIASKTGIYDNEPLRKLAVDILAKKTRSNRSVQVVATDMTNGGLKVWDETADDSLLVNAIIASAAIPGFFPSSKIGNTYYNDGGCLHNIELPSAFAKCIQKKNISDLKNIVVDVISTSPVDLDTDTKDLSKYHSLSFLLRSFQVQLMMSNARYIREAKESFPEVQFRFLIGPSKPLEGNRVSMDPKVIKANFLLGFDDGSAIAKEYNQEETSQFETALVKMEKAIEAFAPQRPNMARSYIDELLQTSKDLRI